MGLREPRHLHGLDGGRIATGQSPQEILTVTLSGDYDFESEHILALLLEPVAQYKAAVIDLSAVTYLESSSLETLLRLRKRLLALRGTADLRLAGANPRILRLFAVTGIDRLFHLYASVDHAFTQDE